MSKLNSSKPLSERQIEILQLVADGGSYKSVAFKLNITPMTIRSHLTDIRKRLDAATTLEAVVKMIRRGVIR